MSEAARTATAPPRRVGTFALIGATLAVMGVLAWIDRQLTTAVVDHGILSFEFAWSTPRARAIVEDWRRLGLVEHAAASLLVDLPFIVLYGAVLVRACRWVGRQRWAGAGRAAAVAVIAAAGLDAIENLALGILLAGLRADVLAPLASTCAAIKFGLAALALVYLAAGTCAVYVGRRTV